MDQTKCTNGFEAIYCYSSTCRNFVGNNPKRYHKSSPLFFQSHFGICADRIVLWESIYMLVPEQKKPGYSHGECPVTKERA